MLSPEIAQLRELIAARIHAADCDCADFASPTCPLRLAGNYRAVADSVLELFPDVEVERTTRTPGLVIPAANYTLAGWAQVATHTQFVLRTAPEQIAEGPA